LLVLPVYVGKGESEALISSPINGVRERRPIVNEDVTISMEQDDRGWAYARVIVWNGNSYKVERLYAYPELMRDEPVA
jgi:hypothetical protein